MKSASCVDGETTGERPARASLTGQDFLARVAHELRGPAGVTLGALEELERESESVSNQQRVLLGMARRGALKILRTAERLSRISQLESGLISFQLTSTDLVELTRRAVTDARALEPRKGVTVELELGSTPLLVALDEAWAHTAMVELIWSALRTAREFVRVEMPSSSSVQIQNDAPSWASAAKRQDSHAQKDSALSLLLTEEIARLHGGTLRMTADASTARALVSFKT